VDGMPVREVSHLPWVPQKWTRSERLEAVQNGNGRRHSHWQGLFSTIEQCRECLQDVLACCPDADSVLYTYLIPVYSQHMLRTFLDPTCWALLPSATPIYRYIAPIIHRSWPDCQVMPQLV